MCYSMTGAGEGGEPRMHGYGALCMLSRSLSSRNQITLHESGTHSSLKWSGKTGSQDTPYLAACHSGILRLSLKVSLTTRQYLSGSFAA